MRSGSPVPAAVTVFLYSKPNLTPLPRPFPNESTCLHLVLRSGCVSNFRLPPRTERVFARAVSFWEEARSRPFLARLKRFGSSKMSFGKPFRPQPPLVVTISPPWFAGFRFDGDALRPEGGVRALPQSRAKTAMGRFHRRCPHLSLLVAAGPQRLPRHRRADESSLSCKPR